MTPQFRLHIYTEKENKIKGNPNKKYKGIPESVIKGVIKGKIKGGDTGNVIKARATPHIRDAKNPIQKNYIIYQSLFEQKCSLLFKQKPLL